MKKHNIGIKQQLGSWSGAIAAAILAFPAGVLAAQGSACGGSFGGFLGLPTWYKYIIQNPADCTLSEDLISAAPKILLAVFEILLRVGGLLAVGMVIYGGIQYIISQGEPDKTKGARTTIINAIAGLIISISAVAIVNLIGRNL